MSLPKADLKGKLYSFISILLVHYDLRACSAAETQRFAILDCRISMELSLPSKYIKLIQQAQVMRLLVLFSKRSFKIHPRYK